MSVTTAEPANPGGLPVIRKPQDVIDLVNEHPSLRGGAVAIFVALGGVLLDAYQATMIGFGNKYIAAQFGISSGLAATVNASVLVAALIGGLASQKIINRLGQKRAFVLAMAVCSFAAVAVAFAPSIWWVLVFRVLMGLGLGVDFPLATNAVAELAGAGSKNSGRSVNLWQMGWYMATTVVYLILIALNSAGIVEERLWRYGILIGGIFGVVVLVSRYFLIGESAIWAGRQGHYDEAVRVLWDRYGVQAVVAPEAESDVPAAERTTKGAYRILFNRTYLRRTVLGCVVATMQAWQYNAVGVYLPLTLAGILTGGLSASLSGSAVVNLLAGVTGGAIGSVIVHRFGSRRQTMTGFGLVAVCLLLLGLLGTSNPWLALVLLGLIIFFHSAGPGGLGMTIATLSYPPSIRPAGIGFARAIMRTGAIAGLILWPMLWGALGTDAFYWLAIVPLVGFFTGLLIHWEPMGYNVDEEDAAVLQEINLEGK
ncbi:MFS transporter [Schaalia naturae]|uniref:MFS transporter n=1 Tax=Schaalia naturae TaxID=635203 RepID=A0ABW2SP24_9ACTO